MIKSIQVNKSGGSVSCGDNNHDHRWSLALHRKVLEIGYGQGNYFPQYAALHLGSSYFRLNYGPCSGWGTSVVLLPSFWQAGYYHLGGRVICTYKIDGADLIISINGTVSGLHSSGQIRLSPPVSNAIHAHVSMSAAGDVTLDNRPGEAFKPVMLSSMHISARKWDAQSAVIDAQSLAILDGGWMMTPTVYGQTFGLTGGTSIWKTNAPTVEITFADPHAITGWVTTSAGPNDDNVGLWAASDKLLASWEYDIVSRQAE